MMRIDLYKKKNTVKKKQSYFSALLESAFILYKDLNEPSKKNFVVICDSF